MQHYLYASVTLLYLEMPSPRKRIGFLPAVEIQNLINQICLEKKISQSKVTGLLVEEALINRGLYEPKLGKKEFIDNLTKVIFSEGFESNINSIDNPMRRENFTDKRQEKISSQETFYSREEFQLLKDFIEYKRFKLMMKRVREEDAI